MVFCFVSCCLVNCYLIDCVGLLDKKIMILLFVLLIDSLFSPVNAIPESNFLASCHNVTHPQCAEFTNATTPNVDDVEVSHALKDISPLFNSNCSIHIQRFACFMLVPPCHQHVYHDNNTNTTMIFSFRAFPCKNFCYALKQACSLYQAFWTFNCSDLPTDNCFAPPGYNGTSNNDTNVTTDPTDSSSVSPVTVILNTTNATSTPIATLAPATCPGRLVHYLGVNYGGVDDCAAPCRYLYEEDRYSSGLVTFLFILWSILSFLAIVSFMLFMLTCRHYSYIEQPYHFVTLCHSFMFLAFLIRLGSGHDAMVCDGRYSNTNDTALITKDVGNAACTTVFIIVYYSLIAMGTWLVNLSISLCTRTQYNWRYYLFAGYHLAGWGIPLIFVIAACVLKMVSGDSLLGMCQLDSHYLPMVLVPLMVCGGLSFILLSCTVVQMLWCSQACVEVQQHRHPGRFLRSLLFGVIVLIEIAVISVLYLVEQVTYEHWEDYYTECIAASSPRSDCSTRTLTRPSYAIPVIRYSLISVVGAISIVWPLARKVTWKSWKDSITLLYQKVVDTFRSCNWRGKTVVLDQLVS